MLGELPSDSNETSAASSEQFSSRAVSAANPHQTTLVMPFKTKENIFMTAKEKAELLFKQERLSGGGSSIPEYEQRARVERTKTAKLQLLRLARDAELTPKPVETGGASEKPTQKKSSKTLRPREGIR
jgi:hypothetical protein